MITKQEHEEYIKECLSKNDLEDDEFWSHICWNCKSKIALTDGLVNILCHSGPLSDGTRPSFGIVFCVPCYKNIAGDQYTLFNIGQAKI